MLGVPSNTPDGSVAGLDFPMSDNTAVKTFTFGGNIFRGVSLHWPSVPSGAGASLTIGLRASLWDGQAWDDVPASVILAPDGPGLLRTVFDPQPNSPLIGKTTILTPSPGGAEMAWTILRPDGTASMYYAATH
jgi:hypothetical protein